VSMSHLPYWGTPSSTNAQYTSGDPDVVSQVGKLLPQRWGADGSTTVNIPDQIRRLPKETTHLVVSVGGNNAPTEASRLGMSFFGSPDVPPLKALDALADVSDDFESQYSSAACGLCEPYRALLHRGRENCKSTGGLGDGEGRPRNGNPRRGITGLSPRRFGA